MDNNLIIETQRIKNLMGVSLISEIKLPSFITDGVESLLSLTFRGLEKGEFEAAFPTITKKGLNGKLLASELTKIDNLTPEQFKVLMKINNANIRKGLINIITNEKDFINVVKVMVAAEAKNDPNSISKTMLILKKYLPESDYDNVVNTIKQKLKSESDELAAKQAVRQAEEQVAKQIKTVANYEDAIKIFETISNSTKSDLMKDAAIKTKARKVMSILKNIKKSEWDALNTIQQTEVDAALAKLKSINPNLLNYIVKYWKGTPKWGQGLILIFVLGSTLGLKFLGFLLNDVTPEIKERIMNISTLIYNAFTPSKEQPATQPTNNNLKPRPY